MEIIILDKEGRFVDVIDGDHRCSYTPYDKEDFIAAVGEAHSGALKWLTRPVTVKTKERLLDALASTRYEKEVSGVTYKGVFISTERKDVDSYYDIYKSLEKGWIDSTVIIKGNSQIVVDLITLGEILKLVSQHKAHVFKVSAEHAAKISELESQSGLDGYDITQGWGK